MVGSCVRSVDLGCICTNTWYDLLQYTNSECVAFEMLRVESVVVIEVNVKHNSFPVARYCEALDRSSFPPMTNLAWIGRSRPVTFPSTGHLT